MEKLLFVRISLVHIFAVFIFGLVARLGDAKTLHCYDCAHVHRPHACTHIRRCAPNQMCAMDVHIKHDHHHDHHDRYEFSLYCQDGHFCPSPGHSLIGRKRAHAPHPDPAHALDLMCRECCQDTERCNAHLCPHYIALAKAAANMTTSAPTMVSATTPSTATSTVHFTANTGPLQQTTTVASTANNTVYDPNCQNKEEDGITCAELDLFRVCTDTSSLHYVLAHEKCRRHCGFCNADPKAPTLPPATRPPSGACTNYEQDGFKCASLDLFHICADTTSLAYVLAHEKCRQHCGFCAHSVVGSSTAPPPASTTVVAAMSPPTATASSAHSSTSGTAGTTALPPVSATPACKDVEENGFSCAYMDTYNICTTSDAMLSNLARDKCSKHCGFCK